MYDSVSRQKVSFGLRLTQALSVRHPSPAQLVTEKKEPVVLSLCTSDEEEVEEEEMVREDQQPHLRRPLFARTGSILLEIPNTGLGQDNVRHVRVIMARADGRVEEWVRQPQPPELIDGYLLPAPPVPTALHGAVGGPNNLHAWYRFSPRVVDEAITVADRLASEKLDEEKWRTHFETQNMQERVHLIAQSPGAALSEREAQHRGQQQRAELRRVFQERMEALYPSPAHQAHHKQQAQALQHRVFRARAVPTPRPVSPRCDYTPPGRGRGHQVHAGLSALPPRMRRRSGRGEDRGAKVW